MSSTVLGTGVTNMNRQGDCLGAHSLLRKPDGSMIRYLIPIIRAMAGKSLVSRPIAKG